MLAVLYRQTTERPGVNMEESWKNSVADRVSETTAQDESRLKLSHQQPRLGPSLSEPSNTLRSAVSDFLRLAPIYLLEWCLNAGQI